MKNKCGSNRLDSANLKIASRALGKVVPRIGEEQFRKLPHRAASRFGSHRNGACPENVLLVAATLKFLITYTTIVKTSIGFVVYFGFEP